MDAAPTQPLDHGLHRDLGLLAPAGCGELAVASVDGDDEPLAELRDGLVEEVDVGIRGGSDHDARRAGFDHVPDRFDRPQAAADLYGHVEFTGDPLDVLEVRRRAGARAVEIDNVEIASPVLDPAPRGIERVGVVHGPGVEVALREPDGLAVEDVDRRQQDHARAASARVVLLCAAHSALKLASIRRPSAEDFSGWNCTPNTDPRATIVANRSPYSAVPTTCAGSAGRAAKECTW